MLSARAQSWAQAALATGAVALLASAIPAVNEYISHENCIATTRSPEFSFLSRPLNEALCAFNVTFTAAYSTRAGKLLVDTFGSSFAAVALLQIYYHGLTGAVVLLVGQLVPICITYPAYQALAAKPDPKLRAERAWVAVLSVGLAYIVPGIHAARSGLEYSALSLWQIYPVYLVALVLLLRPVARFLPSGKFGQMLAGLVMPALAISISMVGYTPLRKALLAGEVSFQDVFYPPTHDFASAAQWVFIVDFVIVMVAGALVASGNAPANAPLPQLALHAQRLLATVFLGPGAGIALIAVQPQES